MTEIAYQFSVADYDWNQWWVEWPRTATITRPPNSLGRRFDAVAPNQVWTTDVTYIWTLEGWLYLAVVIDLFSRQVAGWAVADHMKTTLCVVRYKWPFGAGSQSLACPIILVVAANMPAMNTVSIWLS